MKMNRLLVIVCLLSIKSHVVFCAHSGTMPVFNPSVARLRQGNFAWRALFEQQSEASVMQLFRELGRQNGSLVVPNEKTREHLREFMSWAAEQRSLGKVDQYNKLDSAAVAVYAHSIKSAACCSQW